MPIAANLITNVEAIVFGNIASGGGQSKPTYTTFHFRRTNPALPLSKVDFDTAFQAAIVSKMILALNNRWSQASNSIRWLNDPLDPPFSINHVNAGAVAGDSMPAFNYAYTKLKSTIRGASYRGNIKLGPLSESNTTAGTDDILNAGALALFAAINTALAAPVVDVIGNNWIFQIVSRKLSNFTRQPVALVTATDVALITTRKSIGRLKVRETRSVY